MAKSKKQKRKAIRLFKISRELNVSKDTIVEYLDDEGLELQGSGLNAKVSPEVYTEILEAFSDDKAAVERHEQRVRELREQEQEEKEAAAEEEPAAEAETEEAEEAEPVEAAQEEPAEEPEVAEDLDEDVEVEAAEEPAAEEDLEEAEAEAKVEEEAEPVEAAQETSEPTEEVSTEAAAEEQEEKPEEEAAAPEASAEEASAAEETKAKEETTEEEKEDEEDEEGVVRADRYRLSGPKIIGQIDDEEEEKQETPVKASTEEAEAEKPAKKQKEEEEEEEAVAEEPEEEQEQEAAAAEKPEEEAEEEEVEEEVAPAAESEAEQEEESKDEEEQQELKAEEVEITKPAETAEGEAEEPPEEESEVLSAKRYRLSGPKVVGSVDLKGQKKRKRKRKRKSKVGSTDEGEVNIDEEQVKKAKEQRRAKQKKQKQKKKKPRKRKRRKRKRRKKQEPEVSENEVEKNIQKTKERIQRGGARDARRRRRQQRRERHAERRREEEEKEKEKEKVLELTEFVSANELANLMDLEVTEIIQTCMELGMMVSINQRLDADTITLIADEYGYDITFISEEDYTDIELEEDDPEDLEPRAPVVTVMGHVDHGKTSLLDYIRRTNVVAGESGGITQHIGAYEVILEDERAITFLDTPGHEAFTAMRARGAQVTDVVVLVVAADDAVMPQTIEAINHSQAAGVPLVVAINKMDKPGVNPQKVMQQLADHNVLVEDYGGKVQASKVSAITGDGVDDLMEKILLQAELLELKANPERGAVGTIVEGRLEKGRGNVATVLVQNGTLRVGDTFVAGATSGRVRAMLDERDNEVEEAPPSTPVLVLGFNESPNVGDQFVVLEDEGEARNIAQERQQIQRQQRLRQKKHITLDEIGRRLALGDFQELNLVVKADVTGSVQALSDALLKLSTEEVQVNIIHSGVGAITESDVLLASASDAVIIGFQVRPMRGVNKLSEKEEIDIRTYSVIYDAVEDVRDALEGLLSPEESEKVNGIVEVRETFKVPKVGTVAGSYVLEGTISRQDKVRVVRDGVVIYDGRLASLKRYQDDVKEVATGYECGLAIENYNDIKVGDQVEAYEIVETKRTLNA